MTGLASRASIKRDIGTAPSGAEATPSSAGTRSVPASDARAVVVSRLSGGLGNQLFQYAAGRSLAQRSGARLILDASVFTLPQERRRFALAPYPIGAEVAWDGYPYEPITPLVTFPRPGHVPVGSYSLFDRLVYRLSRGRGRVEKAIRTIYTHVDRARGRTPGLVVFSHRTFDYDPEFARFGPGTYLVGYWQSFRYFVEASDAIGAELRLPGEPDPGNAQWLARIAQRNSVCLHVRRGDYLLPPHDAQHGVCSPAYYRRAMRAVEERVSDPHFFVFSDDLSWSRQQIAGTNVSFVDANAGDAAHEELRLMSACRHHIIANSSLSWWAAWLGRHRDQVVVAPDPWFTAAGRTPDLYPERWMVVPRD